LNLFHFVATVGERFEQRPAVASDSLDLSYGALLDRSRRVAGALRAQGCKPGDRVVLALENCGEFFELLLGCWAAGVCVVPVNAKLHAREIAHIVVDSGARLAFMTPHVADGFGSDDASCPIVITGTHEYDRQFDSAPLAPVELAATARAWLFYTSGTTGRPKGAILSHRNLLAMSLAYYADIDFADERDVSLHMAPLSHAAGLYAIPHLLRGGLQVVKAGFEFDHLADTLARYDHVCLFAAPTMLTRIVRSPKARTLRTQGLKTITYGGGPMYVADLELALDLFGPRLYQVYGQGETPMTIAGLEKRAHGGADCADRLNTCGTPRTGVAVRILLPDGSPAAAGEIGEIVTRSDCVMEGYWNNPEATAATIRDGWLHTGDLGSIDAHGYLSLRDRSKDLIISGGSNIYPREVEEVLLRHPDVIETSVVGRPDPEWGEDVVAFVVLRPGATIGAADLGDLCLQHIARFKRPKHYRFVDQLPKNNYGKVLKTELRALLNGETTS
jgi:acyl-CoA synthetase (AMP-forming)/AMP-acid ligase II